MNEVIKILFLEDLAADAELNALELTNAGFAISSKRVETRDAFIQQLEEFKPDIILADYSLPDFAGMEALEIVLNKKLAIPFIFVSGTLGEELAVDIVKCGATDYVLKQNLLRLAPSVRRALREADEKKKRQEAEESLRESEWMLNEAQNVAKIGSWSLDLNTAKLRWSSEMYRLFGIAPLEFDGSLEVAMRNIHPDDIPRVKEANQKILTDKTPTPLEYRILIPGGGERVVWAEGKLEKNIEGKPARLIGFIQDITERKLAEETIKKSLHEKEVLLKEIHHRVKNNMQEIISLLNLQAAKIHDENLLKLYKDSEHRIRAMALVHEKLYQSNDFTRINIAEYIKNLFDDLYASYAVDQIKIDLEYNAELIELSIVQAVPCGLIINEILSNAFKYAFPVDFGKEKKITLSLQNKSDNVIQIIIGDNGIGMPDTIDFSTSSSSGLYLLNLLVNQLNGKIELDKQCGTMYKITFEKKL